MKKLFFSAVALVVFVNVSFANTIAIEEFSKELNTEKVAVGPHEDCVNLAADFLEELDPNNELSNVAAYWYYQGYYDACMLDKTKKTLSIN